jgi:hypothetical protein
MSKEWPDVVYEDVLDAEEIEDPNRVAFGRGMIFLTTEDGETTLLGEMSDFDVFLKPPL